MLKNSFYFAFLLLFISTSPVKAQLNLSDLGISPISIALSLGQWLIKEDTKVYYLQIESSGKDKESAKTKGFQYAVERAVGTLVVSETEIKNKEVVRNEILKYSSGFISNFKILSEKNSGNQVTLVMDVWVAESKIADRILNTSKEDGLIDGARLAAQLSTLKTESNASTSLLDLILKNYPENAFTIDIGKTKTQITGENAIIKIPAGISWNKKYLESIFEVLKKTNDSSTHAKTIIHYRKKGAWGNETAYYRDSNAGKIIEKYLIESMPELRIIYKDKNNESIAFDCLQIMPLTGIYFGPSSAALFGKDNAANPTGQFIASLEQNKEYYIDGEYEAVLNVFVNINKNSNIINNIYKAEGEVVKRKECLGTSYVADPLSTNN